MTISEKNTQTMLSESETGHTRPEAVTLTRQPLRHHSIMKRELELQFILQSLQER